MSEQITKELSRKILLNPGPATTSTAVKRALLVEDICPREAEFGDLIARVREKCTAVVHGHPDYETILLGASGTGAVEACLTSCVDRERGTVLIIENGAYGERMTAICRSSGIPCESITFEWGAPVDLETITSHLAERNQSITALAFVHHETTVGILNPLDELTVLGKQCGLDVIVDAMSSYAGLPIALSTTAVDYLISSSNKCIQGMAGLGIVVADREALERSSEYRSGNYYFNLFENYRSQKQERQFLFTPPVQVLYALEAALDEFFTETGEARFARYASLYRILLEGMRDIGFKTLVEPQFHAMLLTAFIEPDHPRYDFDAMHDFFFARGITIYPGKCPGHHTFRIANIGDLSIDDMALFLNLMREYLTGYGIRPIYSR
jgi:2-aminoethylphosphonate-pyruvate transaminase